MKAKNQRVSEFDILYRHYKHLQNKLNKITGQKPNMKLVKETQSIRREKIAILKVILKKEILRYNKNN